MRPVSQGNPHGPRGLRGTERLSHGSIPRLGDIYAAFVSATYTRQIVLLEDERNWLLPRIEQK